MPWAPAVRAADVPLGPSLVLHYTLDEDSGAVAKDISPYGNNGKILKAQYVEEVGARQ